MTDDEKLISLSRYDRYNQYTANCYLTQNIITRIMCQSY